MLNIFYNVSELECKLCLKFVKVRVNCVTKTANLIRALELKSEYFHLFNKK